MMEALARDPTADGLHLLQRRFASATRSPYWCAYISKYHFLVPPCWFGSPAAEPPEVEPGYPRWCKHVPESVRFVVLPCAENHNSTTSTSTVGGTVGGTSGLVEPIDLQEIKASKESYRSPYWCGYIQHLVQYLVPPCWFGRPEADPPDLSPGRPTWCQHVPEMARGMVTIPVPARSEAVLSPSSSTPDSICIRGR